MSNTTTAINKNTEPKTFPINPEYKVAEAGQIFFASINLILKKYKMPSKNK